jgi:uncharacterized spore protein YtfJ
MSEEPTSQPAASQTMSEYSAAASLSASSLVIAQETMEQFLRTADLSAVYGDPIEHEGQTIIPTAEVLCVMGFGVGSGGGESGEASAGTGGPAGGSGTGGGGGGGGRVLSRPVAVIVAGPAGVEVKPVVDVTKIAMAGLTAFGFVATMIYRMTRGPR